MENNVQDSVQDNVQEEAKKEVQKRHPDSLCWNCKRALGDPENSCKWARKFHPIKGWKVIRGAKLAKLKEYGTLVLECPEYLQWHEYTSWDDVLETLKKYFHKGIHSIRNHLAQYILQYQKEAPNKFPRWVIYRAQEALEEEAEAQNESGDITKT